MTNFMPRFYHTHTKKKKKKSPKSWKLEEQHHIIPQAPPTHGFALNSTPWFIWYLCAPGKLLPSLFFIYHNSGFYLFIFFNKTWNHVWKKQFNKSMNFGTQTARIQIAALPPRSHVTSLICERGRTAHLFGPESDARERHPEQSRHKWTGHTCQQIPTTPASHHRRPDLRWKQKHRSWKKKPQQSIQIYYKVTLVVTFPNKHTLGLSITFNNLENVNLIYPSKQPVQLWS